MHPLLAAAHDLILAVDNIKPQAPAGAENIKKAFGYFLWLVFLGFFGAFVKNCLAVAFAHHSGNRGEAAMGIVLTLICAAAAGSGAAILTGIVG